MKIPFAPLALLTLALCLLLSASPALAAQAGKPVEDRPASGLDRVTVISVQAEGNDSLGARLATRLKERFNASNLFALNDDEQKDVPKFKLLLSTAPEFPGRPAVGSVYGVCWVFSQGKDYLGFLLAREVGTVNAEELEALVNKLVERTDGITAKYSSLLK